MTAYRKKVLAILSLLIGPAFAAPDHKHDALPTLHFMMEEVDPYTRLENGQPVGPVPELLSELMKRTNQVADYKVVPWQRALATAASEPGTCVMAAKTNERLQHFQWIGPMITDRGVLVAPVESNIAVKTIDDAKQYRIGGYQGDARTIELINNGFNIDSVTDDSLNIKKLAAGRIDLWVSGEAKAKLLMNKTGPKLFKIALIWQPQEIFLACNLAVPQGLIKRMQEAWRTMESDGTAAQIGVRAVP
jgi:polar amino acid transport system substrate-binding protein